MTATKKGTGASNLDLKKYEDLRWIIRKACEEYHEDYYVRPSDSDQYRSHRDEIVEGWTSRLYGEIYGKWSPYMAVEKEAE